jgi:hypothetical protein
MRTVIVLCAAACAMTSATVGAQRLSDSDVRHIITDLDHSRDRFEDALPGRLKDSVLRGARGELNVGKYLDDFQENVGKLKDRFKGNYAASKEAETVLRQAMEIDAYVKSQPPGTPGSSEWERLSIDLNRLAEAYGTRFPLPPDAVVRRMNDGEVAETADDIVKGADTLKKAISRDPAITKAERDAVRTDLDELTKQAKTIKSRASGATPATSETRRLVDLLGKIGAFAQGRPLQPTTLTAWGAMQASIGKLEQAYGMRAP